MGINLKQINLVNCSETFLHAYIHLHPVCHQTRFFPHSGLHRKQDLGGKKNYQVRKGKGGTERERLEFLHFFSFEIRYTLTIQICHHYISLSHSPIFNSFNTFKKYQYEHKIDIMKALKSRMSSKGLNRKVAAELLKKYL